MTIPERKLRLVPLEDEAPVSHEVARDLAQLPSNDLQGSGHPQGAGRGPQPSLEALYERYVPYVAAIASRILGRAAEVDDVVQDVFALAVRGLKRREDVHEIKGWFAKVTVRRCMRQLRYRRIWALVDLAAEPSYERLADPAAGPEERQIIVEVYQALDRVPVRERVPWTLRHVEGESLDQIAVLCGCSLATAKRRIAAAQEKLRGDLHGKGLDGKAHEGRGP